MFEPVFLYFISVFLYATWTNVCEGVRVHKQRRRRVVRGVPYPGGVGGPSTRLAPSVVAYASCRFFFEGYEKLRVETEIFFRNIGDFFGDIRGFPP